MPATLRLNTWGLIGPWVVGREGVMLPSAPGRMAFRFHAADVNLGFTGFRRARIPKYPLPCVVSTANRLWRITDSRSIRMAVAFLKGVWTLEPRASARADQGSDD